MWWRIATITLLFVTAASALTYWRGSRDYRPSLLAEANRSGGITMSAVTAGGQPSQQLSPETNSHYEVNGFDVNEGKRLYQWFNCVGCHANGGGDIGPPLMDDKWIYGSEPRNIYQTITEGRPNGMPSFRGKIADAQIWQIVAYVRSMSGLVAIQAAPGRNDDIQAKPPETMAPTQPQKKGGTPAPDERSSQ
jgi:cytochrome c oxidase cbb3-type subunit 3